MNAAFSRTGKLRILVVEDEALVAMHLEDTLHALGHEVVATASRLPEALEAARTATFDAAIIDVNLDGQHSYDVADVLNERRIPFAFATGYGAAGLQERFRNTPTLAKPFMSSDLERILAQALGAGRAD
ncbi:response regulator [Pelagibacterium limicola]|uniref:response regulator n=1 Tax=Pelagibacterium limicola TaxID=2791022 RepID=UPI0031B61D02